MKLLRHLFIKKILKLILYILKRKLLKNQINLMIKN